MDDPLILRSLESLKTIGFMFVLFTAISLIANGRKAVKWSPELMKSGRVNILFVLVNLILSVYVYYAVTATNKFVSSISIPAIETSFWSQQPYVLKVGATLLVYDFVIYWAHRTLHHRILWPAHAVHHSDSQLHFLTWSRTHFLEHFVIATSLAFATAITGLAPANAFLLVPIMAIHQYYVHSNLDWDHGIFKNVIVSPTFHKWHHADVPAAYDKNFSSIFPIYDILFKTYYCPGSAKNTPTGFDGNPGDHFASLMAYPFVCWARMLKAGLLKLTGKASKSVNNRTT